MTARRLSHVGKSLIFALVLLGSAAVREGPIAAVNEAIIWLPTGVALAGLWWLGLSNWWIVALCTVAQRLLHGYHPPVALPAAAGSAAEAILGVLVLRRLDFRPSLARLRDVGALLVAAGIAPLGSLCFSWIGRSFLWPNPNLPFYAGWDAWWRMNALGVVTVVPFALTWIAIPRQPIGARAAAHAALVGTGLVGLLLFLMRFAPPGATGIMLLNLVLPVALYAAVRFGPRGAASAGALAAIVVAAASTHGFGPFLAVPRPERHVALQLFELTFATFPLVFGALIAERQAALASGLQSEEWRHSILRALPDIAYRIRSDGYCVDLHIPPGVTPAFRREEVVGRFTREFLSAEQADALDRVIRRVLTERIDITTEHEIVLQGRRMIREARSVPYGRDEILSVVRDITHRKWVEGTMAFEARVLELVATGRPTPEIFTAIVEGMERLTRDGICSIILLEGKRLHVAMAPSIPAEFSAGIEGLEIGPRVGSCGTAAYLGKSVVVEDIATDPLWADFREAALSHGLRACWSVPIRGSEGTVLGTFAIYHREPRAPEPMELALAERAGTLAAIVLERERRGEALRQSEDLLASINRNVNEGLFRMTSDLRLIYANLALARLFGHDSPEELIAAAASMVPTDLEHGEPFQRLLAAQGNIVSEEVLFHRPDGSTFWGLVSSTGVRGPDGAILYYDGAIADITAHKELEEQFRQAQKMEAIGKLAGGIAHDFNNLLTAIFGYAECILHEPGAGKPVVTHAEGVLTAAKRAAGLTRQLLAYSRQQVLSPQVLEPGVVVEQLGGMLRRLIGEDIGLVIEPASGTPRVRVDRGQLEQVLLNLVLNARDSMPAGGTLTIRTSALEVDEAFARTQVDLRPGPYVALSVRDTGTGMPPNVQARAFDPFFTTKETGKGTGLGLSTVYGIVKQSGGAVWIDSQPGNGTSVWVCLPRVEAVAAAGSAPPPPPEPRHATVLVVEDEPVVRELVREALLRAGYTVLEAVDGVQALEVVRRHPEVIDLLLTDVVMPWMGGRELAAKLLAERPGLKVLFMSGYPNDALDLREVAGSSGDFIHKPFTSRELIERAHDLLHPGPVES